MGRRERVTAADVKEQLEAYEYLTKAQLAEMFNCSLDTVTTKLRTLRDDGEPIVHSVNGLSLLTKEILKDPEKAVELAKYTDWVIGTFKGLINCMKPVRPLLPAMKKALMQNYTPEERRAVRQNSARIVALITYAEAEDEIA